MARKTLNNLISEVFCENNLLFEYNYSIPQAVEILRKYGINSADKLSQEELKKAYINLSKKYHPDVGGNTADFQKIGAAYEALRKNQGSARQSNQQSNSHSHSHQSNQQTGGKSSKNCTNCGSPLGTNYKFCTNCGTNINSQPGNQQANTNRKDNMQDINDTIDKGWQRMRDFQNDYEASMGGIYGKDANNMMRQNAEKARKEHEEWMAKGREVEKQREAQRAKENAEYERKKRY